MISRIGFLRKIFPQFLKKERKKFFDILLKENCYKMGLTFDIWSSRANDSYICFTGRFVNSVFELKQFVLDTIGFPKLIQLQIFK